jgi:transposase
MPAKVLPPSWVSRRESIRWSKAPYRRCEFIQRFFCRIMHFRRIPIRHDKFVERFVSFIILVAAIVRSA